MKMRERGIPASDGGFVHMAQESRSHLSSLMWAVGAVIFGVLLVTWPVPTLRVLVRLLAVFWLVSGVADVGRSVFKRENGRGWSLLGGIVSIVAGLAILGNPLLGAVFSVGTLVVFAAVAVIFSGIANIFGGTKRTRSKTEKGWTVGRFVLGVLQVGIGVVILMHPVLGLVTVTFAMAIVAIVGGVVAAFGAIFGLQQGKRADDPPSGR